MKDKKVLAWVLHDDNPSVRYCALRDILKRDDNDPDVQATRRGIAKSRIVQKILEKQQPDGYWGEADNPYFPKYKASFWQVMLLGQLGMHRKHGATKRACEYVFRFQHEEGGFTCETSKTALREYDWRRERGVDLPSKRQWVSRKIYEGQLSCLTGNMTTALIRLGYENDQRVRKALAWLVNVQNKDGGWLCPYWTAHVRDEHSCFYGTIGPLEAISEVAPGKGPAGLATAAQRGVEFILMHRLYKADHHGLRTINKRWLQFGFPGFYRYDVLRGLDVVTKLGWVDDARIHDAMEVLLSKQRNDGTWALDNSPVGRMHVNIEQVGKPSKWVTLIASRVLERISFRRSKQKKRA